MPLAAALLLAVMTPQDAPPAQAAAPPATPPAVAATDMTDTSAAASAIAAGEAAFKKHRFRKALADFEKAMEADPQSAAAAFYCGYTHYKLGEPQRRMNEQKEQAKELFAKAFSLDPTFRPDWGAGAAKP
jgi:tetratricopeptide (TPR) repeat protein